MAGHTAIITACAHEAALVRRRLHVQQQAIGTAGLLWQGVMHQQDVVLLQCGMGPELRPRLSSGWGNTISLPGCSALVLPAPCRPS